MPAPARLERLLPDPGPARVLALATFVNTTGNGLFLTGSVLFFTRVIGLSPAQVGLGLSAAGLCGMVAGIPLGHFADRRGPREVLIALTLAEGILMAAYLLVGSFAAFVVLVCVETAVDRGANAVRQALIANMSQGEDRVRVRAYLRSFSNVGLSLGSLFAGVAIHLDTRAAYFALLLGNAVSYVVTALVLRHLPHVAPLPRSDGPRMPVFRDRPYLAFAALNGLLSMHFFMLEIAVPLWIVRDTAAPRWMVAVVFLVNTVVVALFMVKASGGTDTVASSAQVVRRSGLYIGAACVLFGLAGQRAVGVTIVLLLLAALVHVVGEMRHSAGSWGVSFGLPPDHLQGQYAGVNSAAFGLSASFAPLVMTTVVAAGVAGWLGLAMLFVTVAAALVPVVSWAERNRPVLVGG